MKDKQEMIWGNYTWLLFHTIAEKIKNEYFQEEKENLIKYIKKLCSVLPCPDCSNHATYLLNHYDYKCIKNKDDFKRFIFDFHNIVNSRKNYQLEDMPILEKYESAILYKIIYIWNLHFTTTGVNTRLLTDTMRRNSIKKQFLNYMNTNKFKFDD